MSLRKVTQTKVKDEPISSQGRPRRTLRDYALQEAHTDIGSSEAVSEYEQSSIDLTELKSSIDRSLKRISKEIKQVNETMTELEHRIEQLERVNKEQADFINTGSRDEITLE